jgi:hypothetical protein
MKAKRQERVRQLGTKKKYIHEIQSDPKIGRPYKLGIYTPKLGLKPFRLITNMARPRGTV